MSKIYSSLVELIGQTPLLELKRLSSYKQAKARIFGKLECLNPGGSVKDRTALGMIEDAQKKGLLHQGSVIIEPTSGNTGIGLSWIAKLKGYKVIIVMPDSMSKERQHLMKALGAQIVLTPGSLGMQGSIDKALEIKNKTPNAIIAGQFDNPANPKIHEETTAKEILRDLDGNIDIFVCAAGTTGTIIGVGRALKAYNQKIEIVAVEPEKSPVLSGGNPGTHKIQGIGAGFIPKIYDEKVVDEIICVKDEEAFKTTREIAQYEGLLVGISSGAATHAAISLSLKQENKDKKIVVLLPDTGERYLSTDLFDFGE